MKAFQGVSFSEVFDLDLYFFFLTLQFFQFFEAVDQQFSSSATELNYESKEKTQLLIEALGRVSADNREIIILKYRHDCTIKELAEIFKLSESAVKMRIQRTLKELHQILKKRSR